MEELIAKRYVKALKLSSDLEFMKDIATIFSSVAESFKDNAFVSIMNNPNVDVKDKLSILLAAVKEINSSKVNNFIKIFISNCIMNKEA